MKRPCWWNTGNVCQCFTSQPTHSANKFIRQHLVSTLKSGHHRASIQEYEHVLVSCPDDDQCLRVDTRWHLINLFAMCVLVMIESYLLPLILDTNHERKLKFVCEILVLILVVNPQKEKKLCYIYLLSANTCLSITQNNHVLLRSRSFRCMEAVDHSTYP
jgi:hypothetical protein